MRLRIHNKKMFIRVYENWKASRYAWYIGDTKEVARKRLIHACQRYNEKTIDDIVARGFSNFINKGKVRDYADKTQCEKPNVRQYIGMSNIFSSFDYTYNKKRDDFIQRQWAGISGLE